jgi:DNA replication protein DnaC
MKKTTTKTTTQLRDACLSHCATLGIPLEPAALDEVLSQTEKESLSHLQFLDLLLGTQAAARRERSVARRIREARFAESKTLEGFDWQFNPKAFDRVQIEELATGDFIRRRTNLVLVGWSGVGKSHIVQALGQKACIHGYRVLYRTSAALLSDLTASLADKTLPARLRRYASPDFLIIDEFGFDRIERTECPQAAHLLYKIIASRNQKVISAALFGSRPQSDSTPRRGGKLRCQGAGGNEVSLPSDMDRSLQSHSGSTIRQLVENARVLESLQETTLPAGASGSSQHYGG